MDIYIDWEDSNKEKKEKKKEEKEKQKKIYIATFINFLHVFPGKFCFIYG
jgi:hypothetical protein